MSCVCRALARERLVTATQAARQRRRLRFPEEVDPGAVEVEWRSVASIVL